jgi:hypothetical protein
VDVVALFVAAEGERQAKGIMKPTYLPTYLLTYLPFSNWFLAVWILVTYQPQFTYELYYCRYLLIYLPTYYWFLLQFLT